LREKILTDAPPLTYQFIAKKAISKTLNLITMKKIIYVLLFALVTAMSVTACTEEEVTPSTELNGGGAADKDPK
jgi:hypothetical protein